MPLALMIRCAGPFMPHLPLHRDCAHPKRCCPARKDSNILAPRYRHTPLLRPNLLVRRTRSLRRATFGSETMDQQKLDRAIGRRLKTVRTQAGMTLNELAARSGVSRAMIGRVERAQSSATAALLGKVCAALDVSLSDVVALAEKPPERLVRLADQPHWRDPHSGYRRRPPPPAGAAGGIGGFVVGFPARARGADNPRGGD